MLIPVAIINVTGLICFKLVSLQRKTHKVGLLFTFAGFMYEQFVKVNNVNCGIADIDDKKVFCELDYDCKQ